MIVPANFSRVSGAAAYDDRMAEWLRTLGHEVCVIELPGRLPDADKIAVDAAHSVWAELGADSIPVIEGLALPAFADLAAALAPRRATALVHHPAALETGLPPETQQRLLAQEIGLFGATPRLVVTSEQTADRLVAEFRADRNRIAVIAPGAEDPPRSQGSADGCPCAVLSVAPLIPRKGHDILLRAISRLSDLDWRLTIVGPADRDPEHAQGLLSLIEELGVAQRVQIIGETSPDALEALWQGADLFALASWHEGYGSATAEALRRGLPVAVTATGAVPMLVGPEAGVVCAPGDVDQLAKAMRRLIFDRTLRREVAEAAWQASRTLPSWQEQAQRLADLLAE